MNYSNWLDLMSNLGFEDNEQEFKRIESAYNKKNRHYHNSTHVEDCLVQSEMLEETNSNYSLKLAIWYHDIVYKITNKDNELKSAEQAKNFLTQQSADEGLISKVYDLILATIHKERPKNSEEAYIMDIDISILGSDPNTYDKYCQQIRKEYKIIPWFIYRKKRVEVMEMFLERKQLYYTEFFKNKYEMQARINIGDEINKLMN